MATIVFATFGSYGDVLPYIAIGQELKSRGNAVWIATSEFYRTVIEKAGLGFAQMRPDVDYQDREKFQRAMDARRGTEYVVRELVMPHLKESYRDLERAVSESNADLVCSHALTYAVPILAEKQNLRWISSVLSPMMFCSAYEPPALAPIPWLASFRTCGANFNGWVLRQLMKISRGWSEPIRAFRAELGLPPGQDPFWAGQHSPYRVLALFSSLFAQAQPDWPSQTRICGFPLNRPETSPSDVSLKSFVSAGSAPFVFTLGSSAAMVAEGFFELAIKATRRANGRAVLVTGPESDQLSAEVDPARFLVLPWASLDQLFPAAAAIIHSGGVGMIALALRFGKPQIIVPSAHDQFDNAYRVARLGVGITLKRRRLREQTLVETLNQCSPGSSYEEKARSLGSKIQMEEGARKASDEIEDVLVHA